jgi:hypothetical protein
MVTHLPARSVIPNRGAAIRASWLVQDLCGQSGSGQHQRCLCHTSRAGRPKTAKSTNSTAGRSLLHTLPPHVGHTGFGVRDSMWTRRGAPGSSSIPSTLTSGSPTSSSHMRIGFDSTGVLQTGRRRTPPDWQDPCYLPRTSTPRPFPKRQKCGNAHGETIGCDLRRPTERWHHVAAIMMRSLARVLGERAHSCTPTNVASSQPHSEVTATALSSCSNVTGRCSQLCVAAWPGTWEKPPFRGSPKSHGQSPGVRSAKNARLVNG